MQNLNKEIQQNFKKMCERDILFCSSVTGKEVWDLYLKGFKPEDNPIFRDPLSSTHNCNTCNSFIRRYGNVIALDENYQIITLFDNIQEEEYKESARLISAALKSAKIESIFVETKAELKLLNYPGYKPSNDSFQLGIDKNEKIYTEAEAMMYKTPNNDLIVQPKEVRRFHHMHINLPEKFVPKSLASKESIYAKAREDKEVFHRGLETISIDTLRLVRDLINQNSLLNGASYLTKLETFIKFKETYDSLELSKRENWCWITSNDLFVARFRNELIGTICVELSEGKELNKACLDWNKRADPINYMKATAPITPKQIEEAKKFVVENGYEEAFDRRFATIDDIKVSEILHSNVGDSSIKTVSIFDEVKATSTRHKRAEFEKIEEVGIEKFMKDILPTCTSIEAFLTADKESNFVTMTTAKNPDLGKGIFKWNNNYSWTYKGNLAGKSFIKDAVKDRGGNVDNPVRISMFFPNTTNDYDLHVLEPKGGHIYFGNKRRIQPSSGMLDLDAQGGDGHYPPEKRVENITYSDISKMPDGQYKVYVNNYSERGLHTTFTIEVEIEGEITLIELNKTQRENTTNVLFFTKDKGNISLKIEPNFTVLKSESVDKEIYGINTNEFHKINLVCLSPNYWGENVVGNKHYFFMLEKAINKETIRSFHVENLNSDLLLHRKVMEVLGESTLIKGAEKQLTGLGFNATVKDELIVRIQGSFKRVIKIIF